MVKYISPSLVKPYGLNVLRVGVSLVLFWLSWMAGKSPAGIQRKHIGRFFLCGLTGVAINQMLFIKGLTMTSTIHASLLMLCTPLLITLFAFWVLKERITLLKAAGLALGIGGSILLILAKENAANIESNLLGDLLIVSNAISYAVYFILVKPLMKEYTSIHVIRWVFTFGFLMVLPFGWNQFAEVEWRQFSLSQFGALCFIVIGATFLAYYFNAYGIQHLGASMTGSYIYTQPVFAVIIATVFLHESFTVEKLIAGFMIFAGVFLVNFKKSPD